MPILWNDQARSVILISLKTGIVCPFLLKVDSREGIHEGQFKLLTLLPNTLTFVEHFRSEVVFSSCEKVFVTTDYFHLYFIVSMACLNSSFLDGYRAKRLNEKSPWADFVSSSFGRCSRFFSRFVLYLIFLLRALAVARKKSFTPENARAGTGSMQEQRNWSGPPLRFHHGLAHYRHWNCTPK